MGADGPHIGDLRIVAADVLALTINRTERLAVAVADSRIVALRLRDGEAMVGNRGIVQTSEKLLHWAEVRNVCGVVVPRNPICVRSHTRSNVWLRIELLELLHQWRDIRGWQLVAVVEFAGK